MMPIKLKTFHIKVIHLTKLKKDQYQPLTPSDAVMIECKLGIESALSIFTITWISAFEPENQNLKRHHQDTLKTMSTYCL
jgi:hypothetical protein